MQRDGGDGRSPRPRVSSTLGPAPEPGIVWSRRVDGRLTGHYTVALSVRDGRFALVSDEPATEGGGDAGPMPSEFLFASLASCYAMAVAWVARKRHQDVGDLRVAVSGQCDRAERRYARLRVVATSPLASAAPEEFDTILRLAREVCWVTRTVESGVAITVEAGRVSEVNER